MDGSEGDYAVPMGSGHGILTEIFIQIMFCPSFPYFLSIKAKDCHLILFVRTPALNICAKFSKSINIAFLDYLNRVASTLEVNRVAITRQLPPSILQNIVHFSRRNILEFPPLPSKHYDHMAD